MEPYLKSLIAQGRPIDEDQLPRIAYEMINSEVGKHPEVGPPITILRVTRAGAQWIGDKGECQEITAEMKPSNPKQQEPETRKSSDANARLIGILLTVFAASGLFYYVLAKRKHP